MHSGTHPKEPFLPPPLLLTPIWRGISIPEIIWCVLRIVHLQWRPKCSSSPPHCGGPRHTSYPLVPLGWWVTFTYIKPCGQGKSSKSWLPRDFTLLTHNTAHSTLLALYGMWEMGLASVWCLSSNLPPRWTWFLSDLSFHHHLTHKSGSFNFLTENPIKN